MALFRLNLLSTSLLSMEVWTVVTMTHQRLGSMLRILHFTQSKSHLAVNRFYEILWEDASTLSVGCHVVLEVMLKPIGGSHVSCQSHCESTVAILGQTRQRKIPILTKKRPVVLENVNIYYKVAKELNKITQFT